MLRIVSPLAAAALLSACAIAGPDYSAPRIAPDAQFTTTGPGEKSVRSYTSWWRAFNDPALNTLIDQGLAQNLTVARAVEAVVAARESAAANGITDLPSVSLDAAAAASGGSNLDGVATNRNAGFSALWEFDLFGRVARSREAATATIHAATEDAHMARLALIAEIASAYVAARGYQDRIFIARSTLDSQQRTLDLTRRQVAAGAATAAEAAQLAGDVGMTAATIPALEIAIDASIHRLGVLLGREPSALESMFLTSAQIPRLDRTVTPGVPADLIRDRPDIRRAERLLAAATAEIGIAEAALFPSLTLSGNLSVSAAVSWTLGPSLVLPIFDRSQLQASVRLEESEARQAYLAYRKTVLEAVEEVENALSGLEKQRARRVNLAESYRQYQQAAELDDALYAAGESTLFEVLTRQRALYSARDALAQSSVDVALQYIALCLALGGGWDIYLGRN